MSDEPDHDYDLGANSSADLKMRVDRRVEKLEEIEKIKKQIDEWKADDKSEGYEEKQVADAVRMRLKNPQQQYGVLESEAKRTSYRKAAGVETNLEKAAVAAQAFVDSQPQPKSKKGKKKDDWA